MRLRALHIWGLLVLLGGGAARAQPASWKTISSAAGGFSARFPGTPAASDEPTATAIGTMIIHVLSLSDTDGSYFAVGYGDFPKEHIAGSTADALLDGARDGAVGNVKGKLVAERHLTLAGFPGRELKISAPGDLFIVERVFMVHERQVMAVVVVGTTDGRKSDVATFLDSLTLSTASASPP